MKKYLIYNLLLLTGLTLLIAGCKKKFFDINENPNSPGKVAIQTVLPSAELAIAYALGNDFQIFGGIWSQHWTQNPSSSQYKTIEQFAPSNDDFNNPWRVLYSYALEDLRYVANQGQADGQTQYVACAKILEAYTFQLLTDNFGDVPYSEAMKGTEGQFSPKYDPQQQIYDGIISLLDNATALIDINDPLHPGDDDIIFQGDMEQWEKFANTLKLRVYLRMSEIDPAKAQLGILNLSGKVFLGPGEDAKVSYISAGGNTNPLYSAILELSKTQNLVASATTVGAFQDLNDDRLTAFYSPATSSGNYVGLEQGFYDAGTPLASLSLPTAVTAADANDEASALAPVKLLSDYESLFLQAEATARGWLNGVADEDLYYEAIIASFNAYGLNPEEDDSLAILYFQQDSVAYPPANSPIDDKIKAIITQKWLAMVGNQGNEAWTEYRRTGYPTFFTKPRISTIGNGQPARMLYPSDEINRNTNIPTLKRITERVWWDVKDNVVQ